MYAAQGKSQKALSELATGVYYSSLEIGPEHVITATGYYHMANLFYTMVRTEHCGQRHGCVTQEGICCCWLTGEDWPGSLLLRQGGGYLV